MWAGLEGCSILRLHLGMSEREVLVLSAKAAFCFFFNAFFPFPSFSPSSFPYLKEFITSIIQINWSGIIYALLGFLRNTLWLCDLE